MEDIKNIKIISNSPAEEIKSDINIAIKKRIESADIILTIVDEKFTENLSLNEELQLALASKKKNKSQIMLTVVTNNAVVPADFL